MSVTRSTAFAAVELLIIGVTIVTYHNYDAEAVGPLNCTICSRRNVLTSSKPDRLSALAELAFRFFAERKTTESPCSHHVGTERVEVLTPFCAVASSYRASTRPSCLSERYLYRSVTRHKKQGQGKRSRYEPSRTGMNHVASRRRRRLGGVTFVHCGSLASVHTNKPASPSRVHALFQLF